MTTMLDTIEGESAFLRALIHATPSGINKHFAMLAVRGALRSHSPAEFAKMDEDEVWRKYGEMYDIKLLDELVSILWLSAQLKNVSLLIFLGPLFTAQLARPGGVRERHEPAGRRALCPAVGRQA